MSTSSPWRWDGSYLAGMDGWPRFVAAAAPSAHLRRKKRAGKPTIDKFGTIDRLVKVGR